MRILLSLLFSVLSISAYSQQEKETDIIIDNTQQDDTYSAGESIQVNALVRGDLILAGAKLTVNDSVLGDVTAAGGEFFLYGNVEDDVRIAIGRAIIDAEIGDDLIVFGGEVTLTKNAVIHGDLKCTAGKVNMQGKVLGDLHIKGSEVLVDGSVSGTSKIISEELTLGANAKFYEQVQYYTEDGEMDFHHALVDANAEYKDELGEETSDLTLTTLGTKSLKMWIFYVLSTFLIILVLHSLFKNAFSNAIDGLDQHWLKSFGFGLLYLVGIPIAIILAFLLVIGIPLGLFAAAVFALSLLFGHMVGGLLLAYYLRFKRNKAWGFWHITLLALLFVVILRVLTMIPYLGILLSIVVLSITYGALTLKVIQANKSA